MTTQAISAYSLGTIEPTGPDKFPASLAARMIRSKISGSAIKVLVLVATSNAQMIRDIIDVALSSHPLQPVSVSGGTARVFRGTVRRIMAPMPCMVILAESQDDPAFRSFRFAVGSEPMQIIALHDGELVKGSGYQELVTSLCGDPLQLEYEL